MVALVTGGRDSFNSQPLKPEWKMTGHLRLGLSPAWLMPFPELRACPLSLPACQPDCPFILCMYAQGTREREHPSQKALNLHLSLRGNPWHFSCMLTVPGLGLGEPGSSYHHGEQGGEWWVNSTSITSSASLPSSLSNAIRLTPFLKVPGYPDPQGH